LKTLFLLRHAKSSWQYQVADHQRPLQQKGIERILKVAQKNATLWQQLDALYSSPANRALHTATIAAWESQLDFQKLQITPALYTFSSAPVIEFIRHLDNRLNQVMLVGHNPAFTEVANRLSNTPCPDLKTAAWAKIEFDNPTWNKVAQGQLTWEITS
jgi:phosphohistidine phosphatase